LIAGRAKDSSNADYAKDASTAFYASHSSATGIIGVIPIENLPQGALDRLVQVADKAARLALNSSQVQLGDTVQELDTKLMYIVVDESKLGTEAAFVEYTAGRASFAQDASNADVAKKAVDASNADNAKEAIHATYADDASSAKVAYKVAWDDITGTPTEFKPEAHTHGAVDVSTLTGYQKAETAADVAAADSLLTALGKIEKKADDAAKSAGFHTQDGSTIVGLDGYNGPAAEYAGVTSKDSLESALAKIEKKALDSSNTADWGSITNKPTTYDASIVMMGGYEKKSGNVAATDSALTAVGKVEKKVDDVTTAFEGHTHGAADVSTMAGYNGAASSYSAVVAGDTLNQAIAKIERKALDSSNSANWDNIVGKPSEFTPEDHAATKVTSLGSYSKAGSVEDVNVNDSLVTALGKIEKKADDAADEPISAATIDAIVNGTY
jgi:hypothetical protein